MHANLYFTHENFFTFINVCNFYVLLLYFYPASRMHTAGLVRYFVSLSVCLSVYFSNS